jgi:hypothetical protein
MSMAVMEIILVIGREAGSNHEKDARTNHLTSTSKLSTMTCFTCHREEDRGNECHMSLTINRSSMV